MLKGVLALALAAGCGFCDGTPEALPAKLAAMADDFQKQAPTAVSREVLLQRSYRLPHTGFAIGKAAEEQRAAYLVHEVICDFGFGRLKGSPGGNILEMREVLEMDGRATQTPVAARKALQTDISAGEERIRKKLLTEFTGLGLVDVATDYGSILLLFTTRGQHSLEMSSAGSEFVGTEPASVFEWQQREGGALEFRGRKTAVRPMHGKLWVGSDGMPLRVTATFEHDEPKHALRDDATVEYVRTSFGTAMPASVVHRHCVDDQVLTENLYLYGPFRRFESDSTIRFQAAPTEPK